MKSITFSANCSIGADTQAYNFRSIIYKYCVFCSQYTKIIGFFLNSSMISMVCGVYNLYILYIVLYRAFLAYQNYRISIIIIIDKTNNTIQYTIYINYIQYIIVVKYLFSLKNFLLKLQKFYNFRILRHNTRKLQIGQVHFSSCKCLISLRFYL